MFAQIGKRLFKSAAHGVEGFVHRFEVRGIQTFEADQHTLATAALQQVEKFLVMGSIDGGLTDPANAERDQGTEKVFCLGKIGRDVVVHEEKQLALALERSEFGEN